MFSACRCTVVVAGRASRPDVPASTPLHLLHNVARESIMANSGLSLADCVSLARLICRRYRDPTGTGKETLAEEAQLLAASAPHVLELADVRLDDRVHTTGSP